MKKNYHFDWDDNIIYMPTNIILFNDQGMELLLSTKRFAELKQDIGKNHVLIKFKYKKKYLEASEDGDSLLDIKVFNVNPEESFREFRSYKDKNYFIDHLKVALKNKSFAPSWNDFIEACNHKKSAQSLSIITARGQSPQCIFEGLKFLKEKKIIKYLPLKRNIYPISYKAQNVVKPAFAKKEVLEKLLDELELKAKELGTSLKIGFSEDDAHTFQYVKNFIVKNKKKWRNVEINLYYTGNGKKERHKLSEGVINV